MWKTRLQVVCTVLRFRFYDEKEVYTMYYKPENCLSSVVLDRSSQNVSAWYCGRYVNRPRDFKKNNLHIRWICG